MTSVVIAFGTGSRWEQFQKIGSIPFWLLSAGVMSAGVYLVTFR